MLLASCTTKKRHPQTTAHLHLLICRAVPPIHGKLRYLGNFLSILQPWRNTEIPVWTILKHNWTGSSNSRPSLRSELPKSSAGLLLSHIRGKPGSRPGLKCGNALKESSRPSSLPKAHFLWGSLASSVNNSFKITIIYGLFLFSRNTLRNIQNNDTP